MSAISPPLSSQARLPFTARDAWLARRLVTGRARNGDMDVASEGFRPIAERMAAAGDLAISKAVLDDWVKHRPDGEAIKLAVATADPEGPAPEADADVA